MRSLGQVLIQHDCVLRKETQRRRQREKTGKAARERGPEPSCSSGTSEGTTDRHLDLGLPPSTVGDNKPPNLEDFVTAALGSRHLA